MTNQLSSSVQKCLVALSLIILGCQSQKSSPPSEVSAAVWSGRMQGLASEVRDLIPYLYSRSAFQNIDNQQKISNGLKAFAKQAHAISPENGTTFFGADPMVQYSLDNLSSDLKRSSEAFDAGQIEYARSVAKSATNHCFNCHSITRSEKQAAWELSQFNSLQLAPLERIDLLVAARKFDEAARQLESILIDPNFIKTQPFDFESSLRKYVALVIRADNKPDRPLAELEKLSALKGVPFYVKEQTAAWIVSLKEWKKAKKTPKGDLLAAAAERIKRAGQLQQYAKDHAGDVEFLRATSILHDLIKQTKNSKDLANAYYLMGQSYEVLDELGYWNLHEAYYESCIKSANHSLTAQKCFARLESSIYFGYSGSSGVHVPAIEQERLKKYKELSL